MERAKENGHFAVVDWWKKNDSLKNYR
jgi:hypothetical protein